MGQIAADKPPNLSLLDGRTLPGQQRLYGGKLGEGRDTDENEYKDANRQGYLDESIL
ncbi:hypothetical protein PTW35_12910 [Photobacterium sp. DA100]|uniref:hypothetical protein n=1 Tax=Photobacterium sp. DA100 TaxID=3027472 RepID=UPI00247A07EF|nr:hypothetical protein [Photobacterium sp. DA100]WEM44087.1 hypothetical protein PTW35_12910 [Photobacterium sp. DA100]